jgi:GMP reductase
MRFEEDIKLDFNDVLIKPKRSNLSSRSDVDIMREFKHPSPDIGSWNLTPLIAANMDTVGSFEMAKILTSFPHNCMVALHKHYTVTELVSFFSSSITSNVFYSMGISDVEINKLKDFISAYGHAPFNICIDVANGYSVNFLNKVKLIKEIVPFSFIMAGNVVSAEITEELILSGVHCVKVGIGSGSACTTRKMTGVGFPQLSSIIECADAAHGLGGYICSDGGCTVAGDVTKALGAGADFVMLGGMLSGCDESKGELIEINGEMFKQYYGMSSDTAMNKYHGGVAEYRSSEGRTVLVPYKGSADGTIREILGGVRSGMTYIGASKLKEIPKRTTFLKVNRQLNNVFGDGK